MFCKAKKDRERGHSALQIRLESKLINKSIALLLPLLQPHALVTISHAGHSTRARAMVATKMTANTAVVCCKLNYNYGQVKHSKVLP